MSEAATLLLVVALLFGPYLLVRRSWGRGLDAIDVAAAPAASIVVLAWCALALTVAGVALTPLTAVLALVVVCAIVAGVRVVRGRTATRSQAVGSGDRSEAAADAAAAPAPVDRTAARRRTVLGFLLALVAVAGLVILWPPGGLGTVPSSWDGVWHGYLSALIQRGGDAAPWLLARLDPQLAEPIAYYPYGYHLVVALVAPFGGVPAGMNALGVLAGSIVGVAGTAAAARELFPRSRAAVLTAPAVLVLIGLWQVRIQGIPPYALGIALIPGVLALLLRMVRKGWDLGSSVPFALACAGLVVVQPAALFSLVLVVLPLLLLLAWRSFRPEAERPGLPWLRVLRAGVMVLVMAGPWLLESLTVAGGTLAVLRPTRFGLGQAILDGLLLRDDGVDTPLLVGLLVVAGVAVYAWRGAPRWLLASWGLSLAFYVVAASGPERVRRLLTGVWFTDWPRLSAVLAVVSALVVGGAVAAAANALPRRALVASGAVLAAVGLVAAVLSIPTYREAPLRTPALVTADERVAFAWLASRVAPGERVLNIWRDGSTWAYSLDGVMVANPYGASIARIPGRQYLMTHMRAMGRNDRVDAELVRLDARWAIVDPTAVRPKPDSTVWFPADSPYAHLELQVGETKVYRLDLERLAATSS